MKKVLFIYIIVLLTDLFSREFVLTEGEKEFLNQKKVLNICVDPDWMPFEKIDKDGRYIGIISDYAKLFSKKLGIEFQLQPTKNFKQSMVFLKNGVCDLIMADVATKERKKLFLATKPYFISPRAYVTHNDTPWVSDFSYLLVKDHKVGVLKNSPAVEILKDKYKNINLVEYETTKEGLKAVLSKNIIAYVSVMPNIAYVIQQNLFSNIEISGYLNSNVKLSVLINKNLGELVPIFNKAIDDITERDKLDIFGKWIVVKFKENNYYKYLWIILSVVVLLLLIISYVNFILNKRVKKEVEKNKQQQLFMLQQSKLAQMGEMISMIAHQWRQPLNTLSTLIQSLILKYKIGKIDDEYIEYFDKSSKNLIQNMSQTIDDFRNFFKPEKQKTEFILNEIILNILHMIDIPLKESNIKVEFIHHDNLKILGYPNEFGQVVLNIINNAKDAILEKNIKDGKIIIELRKDERGIFLTIGDNAGGIPSNIIDKIFDPYFSTKDEKNGTGLGLYMSKLIIEEHMDGVLKVSNKGKGANFTIIFK